LSLFVSRARAQLTEGVSGNSVILPNNLATQEKIQKF